MDHKQKGIIFSAIIKLYIVIYIVIFVVGIMKLLSGLSPAECFWELILIFLMPVIGYFILHSRRRVYFPKSIAGLRVHPQRTRKALVGRIKAYILDSLQYAVVITALIFAMDLWDAHSDGSLANFGMNEWLDTAGIMLLQFAVFFAAYFAIDFVIYETKAKKYTEQKKRRKKREKEYKEKMKENIEDETNGF